MANIVTKVFTAGFRLIDGSLLNSAFSQINAAFAGTAAIVINATGTFNGVIGGTTPAAATFTYSRQSVADGLTAAGTNRATALQLAAAINVVATAGASTGVLLPAAATVGIGGVVTVFNDGASAMQIYATGSETIDGVAGATGVVLTNAKRSDYYLTTALKWKSAQLGVVSA